MEIYTLVGKSGTGKSFHAMELCQKYHIEAIIDDGLFIYDNTVVAGVSAKREATKIGAVKVALFQDDEIRDQVAGAIAKKKPDSILVLGTSVGMTDKIILRLGLLEDGSVADDPKRTGVADGVKGEGTTDDLKCEGVDDSKAGAGGEGVDDNKVGAGGEGADDSTVGSGAEASGGEEAEEVGCGQAVGEEAEEAGCGQAGGEEGESVERESHRTERGAEESSVETGSSSETGSGWEVRIRRNGAKLKELERVHRIFIEDITTEEERQAARTQRDKLGKHVIPAPALQLKRNFAGYFMDPLRLFRGKDPGAASERTVVRPTYSYMGEYFVDERVLEDIVTCIAYNMPAVGSVIRVSQDPRPEAFKLSVAVKVNRGWPIWETAETLQNAINDKVELMTAFNVTEVNVEIRAIE